MNHRTPAIKALGGYTGARRVQQILKELAELYPNAACLLHYGNAFELLVTTILSAQCTDARVNQVTPELFRKYPTPQAFAALRPEQLEPEIHSTGFFRNKAKSVVGTSQQLVARFGGQVPKTMDELLTLPGVARKTANVVLGTAYHVASGIVVDTHVFRVATRRLRLAKATTAAGVEQDLIALVPRDRWIPFSYQTTLFGRDLCLARKPRCAQCPLEPICDSPEKTV